jgi:hypothetical protein
MGRAAIIATTVVAAAGGIILTTTPSGGGSQANLWVDTNGGTCTRTAGAGGVYADAAACSSFAAATSAATSGDTVRVKTGTYGPQGNVGSSGTTLTFIGEDGATVDSGSNNAGTGTSSYNTFNLSGDATVDNVDVTGDWPIVQVFGDNNTWKNSSLTGREIRTCSPGTDEPFLIASGDDVNEIANTLIQNVYFGQFKGHLAGSGGCPGDDNFHLEQARVGRNVQGLTFDRVHFEDCPDGSGFVGCGSGNLFFTTTSDAAASSTPDDILVVNSVFEQGNCNMQTANTFDSDAVTWTFAYNTFADSEPVCWTSTPDTVNWVGNLGTRPQNCTGGHTYVKNVWQWGSGTACGTDTRVTGSNFATDQLGINATTFKLESGSPAIDAAETPGASDACTDAASVNSLDFEGTVRPQGSVCDAGWDER